MGTEIERKFLIDTELWTPSSSYSDIRQGYLSTDINRIVRVRTADTIGLLTIKGKNSGISRPEFEYEIPHKDALEMFNFCEKPLLEKSRYFEVHEGHTWSIDIFHGDNTGLILAEIELKNVHEQFVSPPWIKQEVTEDFRYSNAYLVKMPFKDWGN